MRKVIVVDFLNRKVRGNLIRDGEWYRLWLLRSCYGLYDDFEVDEDGDVLEKAHLRLESLARLEQVLDSPSQSEKLYGEYKSQYLDLAEDHSTLEDIRVLKKKLPRLKLDDDVMARTLAAVRFSFLRRELLQKEVLERVFRDGNHVFSAYLIDQFVWGHLNR